MCLIVAALAGCESPKITAANEAEKRHEMAQRLGSLGDECATAREVQNAWLAALDQAQFTQAKLTADVECDTAQREGRDMPADNAERQKIEEGAIADADNALNAAANVVADSAAARADNRTAAANDINQAGE